MHWPLLLALLTGPLAVFAGGKTVDKTDRTLPVLDLAWIKEQGFLDKSRKFTLDGIKSINRFKARNPEDGVHALDDHDHHHFLRPGEFRTGRINIGAVGMRTIHPEKVAAEMESFIHWMNASEKKSGGIDAEEFAAESFLRLVIPHPFDGANGRSSRLLLNTVLLRYDRPAVKLDLLDWDRGPYDHAPDDVRYLAFLLKSVQGGRVMKGWRRYDRKIGELPNDVRKLQDAKSISAGDFLDMINSYLLWAPPLPDIVARLHAKAGLTPEEHWEFLRLLEIGARRALHPNTRVDFERLKDRFSR